MPKSLELYAYKAQLDRVVDGDTVDAMIDLGFGVWVKKRIRFMGVDTWESRTRNKAEKKRGLRAKAYTKDMLEADKGLFTVKSHGVGKYGRVLGELFIKGHKNSLNDLLKIQGHAYEYHGGKKKAFLGL